MNPTERQELAGLLPSPGAPVLSSDRMTLMEAHLMQEITKEAPTPTPTPAPAGASRVRPRRLRRAVVLLAVPVTAAAVLTTVLTVGGDDPAGPATDSEAVALLDRIATVTAAKDAPAIRDDQYVYTLIQGTEDLTDKGLDTFRRADWHAVDGRRDGLARTTVLSGPSGKGTTDMRLQADPNATTYRELQALPTDPGALYDKVWSATEGQGPTHEEAALEMIGSMLEGATLLPDVGATLYRAAARIPGITVVDGAEDASGRSGVGLAFGDGEDRQVWVFDKHLAYLGSDDVALLDVSVVDRLGQNPAG
ncbi:CU044_5270 family protein [Streptomyces sp. NA04227]|uniref:CU044_5270 family protein n=1 Tax=Streptomyces sp. NA04227 TaxID=2742136 RepID=UPI001591332C|nr:CU044_5270 family protein [Streptomyces sp. NA04227]QKW09996.1 CU044_5270 family protein [Streptomyces sp. NA04227]